MKKLYKKFLLWLMTTKLYYFILMHVVPYVRFSVYYTPFRGWKYVRGYRLLQPGDFIVVRDDKKATAILIPGLWSHAAQCIAKGGEWEISEMTHHNYTKSCFFDLCKEASRVAIYRCDKYDLNYVNQTVIPTCKSFDDAIYDVQFKDAQTAAAAVMKLQIPALYCSELVYQSDPERRLGASLEDLEGLGRPYISPTGLTLAENVRCIWDSDNEVEPNWHN